MRWSKHKYTKQIFTSLFFNLLHAFHHDSQFHPSDSNFEQCTIVNTSHGVHNTIQRFRKYKYKSKSEICNAQTCQWFLEVRRTKERHKIRPNTNSSYTIWYFNHSFQITQTTIALQILLGFVNSLIDLAWNLGTTSDKIGLDLRAGMITVGTLIVPICHMSLLLRSVSTNVPRTKINYFLSTGMD